VLIMKQKMQNDLDDLCHFVLSSNSEYDYLVRFNFLISIICYDFENLIKSKNHLPFFTPNYVDEYNSILNDVIQKLNQEKLFDNLEFEDDIFLLILKDSFAEEYKMWEYQQQIIN